MFCCWSVFLGGINWSPALRCCIQTHPGMTTQPGRNATGATHSQTHTCIQIFREHLHSHTRANSSIHSDVHLSTTHTHAHSHKITRYKRHWQKIQTRLGSLLTTPVNTAFAWRMQLMLLGESLPTHLYTYTQTTHGSSLVSVFTVENILYSCQDPFLALLCVSLPHCLAHEGVCLLFQSAFISLWLTSLLHLITVVYETEDISSVCNELAELLMQAVLPIPQ